MMLHTALTVWRLSLPDCLQSPQATVPHPMLHLPSMQHAPSVPVNTPSLPLETGHWTLPPMNAVPCASSPKVHTVLGSLPIISWHSACPLGWLLAVLKRKQATTWTWSSPVASGLLTCRQLPHGTWHCPVTVRPADLSTQSNHSKTP